MDKVNDANELFAATLKDLSMLQQLIDVIRFKRFAKIPCNIDEFNCLKFYSERIDVNCNNLKELFDKELFENGFES